MNTRFLCTEVVGRKLTQLFIRTKNDIGSNGTFIVDTILSPALSDVYVSLYAPAFTVGRFSRSYLIKYFGRLRNHSILCA